ncbi:hypothetical protein COBT_002809, partial [Conglomerata obtusa]
MHKFHMQNFNFNYTIINAMQNTELIDILLGKRDLIRYGKVFERFKTWTNNSNNSQDESLNEEQLHEGTYGRNEVDTNDYSETSNFNGENTHVANTNT